MAINTDKYFFWVKQLKKIIWDPFWWVLVMAVVFWVPFLRVWWWVVAPLVLSIELKILYLWWLRWDVAYAKKKWLLLEIIPPKEVLIPLKAMEDVFSTLWGPLYDAPNFRELWCDGILNESPNWISFEIVSIEGKIHFFVKTAVDQRAILENALYSYYPDLEIHEVQDYVKRVPQNIPNKEWDLYGEEFILRKPSPYPIKTYEKFFEPQGEKISDEEKRIDPMNSLLESMSRLGTGEHYWMQCIIAIENTSEGSQIRKEANEIINKIAKRKGVDSSKSESGEREMVLTPGEREAVTEVENKMKKPIFRTVLRGVYVAKRENFKSANRLILRSYMGHFKTENLNDFSFDVNTRTKVHFIFRKRRVFLRSRRMLRNAVLRFPPYFPNRSKGYALLAPDELATIFHLPIKMTGMSAPTMVKIESKKSGPPSNLPVE